MREVDPQIEYWMRVAAYLASCHAATAEGEGQLSRTSKASRARLKSICESAAQMMAGNDCGMPWGAVRQGGDAARKAAAERCMKAAKELA